MLLPSGVGSAIDDKSGKPGDCPLVRATDRHELGRAAVTDGDRAGLVEQERIDIAGDLDGLAALGDQVGRERPVHPGNTDRGEQRANRGGNQTDQKSDQGWNIEHEPEIEGHRVKRRRDDQEDDRERGKHDRERDLVRRLLPRCAFDQGDHLVEKALPWLGGDLDHDPVGEDARAARHSRVVAAGLADHGALSPVIADSSTEATPSTTSPSEGITCPASIATQVAGAELGRGDELAGCQSRAIELEGGRVLPGLAEAIGLGLAARFGECLGEVGEQDRQAVRAPVSLINDRARAARDAIDPMATMVVSTKPTSTRNITGFFAIMAGLSMTNDCRAAILTRLGSNSRCLRVWRRWF